MVQGESICEQYRGRLKRKIGLLGEYNDATTNMIKSLESGDVQLVAASTVARQNVVEKITRFDKELLRWIMKNGFSFDKLSGKGKDLVKGDLQRIGKILELLCNREHSCLALAQAEYESLKSENLRTRQGVKGANGYGAIRSPGAKYLDVRR